VKRRIELRIDELRLPPGVRGGPRALAAISNHVETLLQRADGSGLPHDAHAAAARGIHGAISAAARERRA
jgi:hypothetical protein